MSELNIQSLEHDDVSVNFTFVFLKASGFWMGGNRAEQRYRNLVLAFTIVGFFFMGSTMVIDIYYTWGDIGGRINGTMQRKFMHMWYVPVFHWDPQLTNVKARRGHLSVKESSTFLSAKSWSMFASYSGINYGYILQTSLYIACNILTLMLAFLKLFTMLLHRKNFFELVVYLQQEFLHSNYDSYEKTILNRCKCICTFFICCFTCFVHATLVSYVISPIVANIGKNASDRILPFNMWGDLVRTTPYFEITFVLQGVFMYQIGLCYFCFDNFLCIMTIHVAGQFRILQYRLENMQKVKNKRNHSGNPAREYCAAFTHYVQQHQALIAYCKKLEGVFSIFAFGQVLVFSMLICLDGYQVLMADAPTARRLIFVFHIMGCSSQLFMFTYSCDCLMQDSTNVAKAMYAAPWTRLPMNEDGKMMRRDLLLVIMRSRLPCCITACGFFAISLETYTRILSTAMSYFTLLKKNAADLENT